MRDLAAVSLVHALVAWACVEGLLLLWRVRDPGERLRFRLLALAVPLLLTPALSLVPLRGTERFRDALALFSSAEWDQLRPLGLPIRTLLAGAATLAGTALLARDLSALGRQPGTPLSVSGVLRPAMSVSPSARARLSAAELEAALAHEQAHIDRRDPLLSWALVAARMLLFFNPVAQVMARAAAHEVERRADQDAAAAVGSRRVVASALTALQDSPHGARAVELRVRRLLDSGDAPAGARAAPALRLLLTGASLAALLFFVV